MCWGSESLSIWLKVIQPMSKQLNWLLNFWLNSNAFVVARQNQFHGQTKSIPHHPRQLFGLKTCEGFKFNSCGHLPSQSPSLTLLAQGTLVNGGKRKTWVNVPIINCCIRNYHDTSWLKVTIHHFSQFWGVMEQLFFMWHLLGIWEGWVI